MVGEILTSSPVCSRAPRVYSSSSKRAGSLAISCDPGGRHGQRELTTSHVVGVAGLGKGASEAAGLGDKVLTSIHGVARVAQVCLRTHRAGGERRTSSTPSVEGICSMASKRSRMAARSSPPAPASTSSSL